MSQEKNKVEWCLKKALREIDEKGRHRGLIRVLPNKAKAKRHIEKAEHYLEATLFLKENFLDISASTLFYSIYHSLLAILSKFGYESGNQECTFALIYSFIEDKKISIDKDLIDKISSINSEEKSVIELREKYQYGVELSMKEELFNENFELAKKVIGTTKVIIEE
ncbi:MAG: hypothetical protein Q8N99_01710 [Nanoarchaeota archaeon]|nr:hypothetical protein [Nanoarchaeota archaeon]